MEQTQTDIEQANQQLTKAEDQRSLNESLLHFEQQLSCWSAAPN